MPADFLFSIPFFFRLKYEKNTVLKYIWGADKKQAIHKKTKPKLKKSAINNL